MKPRTCSNCKKTIGIFYLKFINDPTNILCRFCQKDLLNSSIIKEELGQSSNTEDVTKTFLYRNYKNNSDILKGTTYMDATLKTLTTMLLDRLESDFYNNNETKLYVDVESIMSDNKLQLKIYNYHSLSQYNLFLTCLVLILIIKNYKLYFPKVLFRELVASDISNILLSASLDHNIKYVDLAMHYMQGLMCEANILSLIMRPLNVFALKSSNIEVYNYVLSLLKYVKDKKTVTFLLFDITRLMDQHYKDRSLVNRLGELKQLVARRIDDEAENML